MIALIVKIQQKIVDLLPQDKCLHFIAGVIIGGLLCLIHPILSAFSVCFIAAVKEIVDRFKPNGKADNVDCLFTVAGGMFVIVLMVLSKIIY